MAMNLGNGFGELLGQYLNGGGIYFNKQQDMAFYQQQLQQKTPYGQYASPTLAQAVGRQFPPKRPDRPFTRDANGRAYDWAGNSIPEGGEIPLHPLAWLDARVNEVRVAL